MPSTLWASTSASESIMFLQKVMWVRASFTCWSEGYRLGYMIYCKNIRPENILTVTYTVAATRDMKARFIRFFEEEEGDVGAGLLHLLV